MSDPTDGPDDRDGDPGNGGADRWVLSAVGAGTVTVPAGGSVSAGRSPDCDLCVPGDGRLSRVQFTATAAADGADGAAVAVRDETGGRNPLFAAGERVEGERLVTARVALAAGRTRFRLIPPRTASGPGDGGEPDMTQTVGAAFEGATLDGGTLTFDARTLAAAPVTRPDRRLEALTRLPEVLRTAGPARDAALCGLILAGTPDAASVALVRPAPAASRRFDAAEWTARDELSGPPSVPAEVVAAALTGGAATLGRGETVGGGWAFCVPIPAADGGPAGSGLLVSGSRETDDPRERTADVRFAALVAEAVAAADRSARLERQAAALRPFLPPRVLADLGDDPDPARLAPVECTATVLFCDLRGFSRTSEQVLAEGGAGDLTKLLGRVSAALSVMTRRIREFGGVTGDFLGDAALAFWGWPDADPDAPLKAARAALGIAADFAADRPDDDPLAGFRVGVGVATGPAVAGRIGTEEQAKITVFGPVANLASRLEGLCRPLRVPVVCDAATAAAVRESCDDGGTGVRVRPLATVRPAGLDRAEAVCELLAPADSHPLSDGDLARYAEAVAAFTAGDWPRAADLLQDHPSADLAQDFLRVRLAERHRTAPPDWDGAVRIEGK